MIIRIIATALIQCTTRTQAGWITFAETAAVPDSLAVMLDMAVPPEFAPDYTRKSPSRYCDSGEFTSPSFRGVAQRRTRNPGESCISGFRARAKSAPRNDGADMVS